MPRQRQPGSAASRPSLIWQVIGSVIVASIGAGLTLWPSVHQSDGESRSHRPLQVSRDDYVSSNVCRSCHPTEYASWFRSFHRTMTQVATSTAIVPQFSGTVADVHGRPMSLEQRGREYWATFDDPDSRAHTRITRQVVLVTGSHQQQQFWYSTGRDRLLGKLPGVYLIDQGRWVPRQSVFLRPPDMADGSDTGAWNAVCIGCHTTSGRPRLDVPFGAGPVSSLRADSEVGEFGIACEACHGPGRLHVSHNQAPWRRYRLHLLGEPDRTIANPSRLGAARGSQVCGQCHSIWEFYGIDDERAANLHGLPYRPGDELRDSRFIAQPTVNSDSQALAEILADDPRFIQDSFWSDGMVRVSGREYSAMIESPCFRFAHEEKRTMSCSSCHQLHVDDASASVPAWADGHQLARGMDGNDACLQCHPKYRAALRDHTKHQSDAANRCYNCHMPYTSYGLLRALRSHQVSIPDASVSVATGRPNACNLCHLDKTLRWSANELAALYGKVVPRDYGTYGDVSAAVLWLVRGDAGQRALLAWAFGWEPAMEASGSGWRAPLLAETLKDPYDAVRMIAAQSLRVQPGLEGVLYDVSRSREVGELAATEAMSRWTSSPHAQLRAGTSPDAVLMSPDGTPRVDEILKLQKQRDDRPIALRE